MRLRQRRRGRPWRQLTLASQQRAQQLPLTRHRRLASQDEKPHELSLRHCDMMTHQLMQSTVLLMRTALDFRRVGLPHAGSLLPLCQCVAALLCLCRQAQALLLAPVHFGRLFASRMPRRLRCLRYRQWMHPQMSRLLAQLRVPLQPVQPHPQGSMPLSVRLLACRSEGQFPFEPGYAAALLLD